MMCSIWCMRKLLPSSRQPWDKNMSEKSVRIVTTKTGTRLAVFQSGKVTRLPAMPKVPEKNPGTLGSIAFLTISGAIGGAMTLAAFKFVPGAAGMATLNTPSVTHNNPNSVSYYRTTANGAAFDAYAQGISVTSPQGWGAIVLGNNGAPVYSGPYGSTYLYVDVDGNTVLALLIHTDTGSGITYHSLSNMTGTAITVAGSMNVTLSPEGNYTE